MATEPAPATGATATHAGITVSSNSETEEQVREAIGAPSVEEETSEAASKLGKKGGAAAAEARKARAAEPERPEGAEKAQADGAADEDDDAEGAAAGKKGKPRSNPVSRVEQLKGQISSLAAEKRAEEQRLQQLRAERQAAEREREPPRPAPVQAKAAAPAAPEDPEPNPDDAKYAEGQYDRQFLKDQARWEARQELKEARERDRTEAEQRERGKARQERYTTFQGRMDDAAQKPEFVARLKALQGDQAASRALVEILNATPWDEVPPGEMRGPQNLIAHTLISSALAPELTLHLVEHPDVYQRLVTLTPDDLIRELARIEARIEIELQPPAAATAGTARRAAEVSRAKPPLQPVRAMAHTADVDLSELSNITELDSYARRTGFKGHKAGLR